MGYSVDYRVGVVEAGTEGRESHHATAKPAGKNTRRPQRFHQLSITRLTAVCLGATQRSSTPFLHMRRHVAFLGHPNNFHLDPLCCCPSGPVPTRPYLPRPRVSPSSSSSWLSSSWSSSDSSSASPAATKAPYPTCTLPRAPAGPSRFADSAPDLRAPPKRRLGRDRTRRGRCARNRPRRGDTSLTTACRDVSVPWVKGKNSGIAFAYI